jgi:hypothetical protein
MSILGNFATRLFWDGRRGGATYDGVHVELRTKPIAMVWAEVDWAPECVATCRDVDGPVRDLDAAEITLIRGYLAHMAQRARSD